MQPGLCIPGGALPSPTGGMSPDEHQNAPTPTTAQSCLRTVPAPVPIVTFTPTHTIQDSFMSKLEST